MFDKRLINETWMYKFRFRNNDFQKDISYKKHCLEISSCRRKISCICGLWTILLTISAEKVHVQIIIQYFLSFTVAWTFDRSGLYNINFICASSLMLTHPLFATICLNFSLQSEK